MIHEGGTGPGFGGLFDMAVTKGMTLPLISYGGSSMLASGITLGILLALTRRQPASGRAS